MHVVDVETARATFFRLLVRARRGETIIITHRGRAIARIVPPDGKEAGMGNEVQAVAAGG